MNPKYAPTTPEGRLSRLAEEIGEVMIEAGAALQLVGKIQRFGLASHHPDGGPNNAELLLAAHGKLENELRDLKQAMLLVDDDITDFLDEQAGTKE